MPFARPARLAAAVLTLTLSTSAAVIAAPEAPAEEGPSSSGQSSTVTLITGDKVTVHGDKLGTVQPGPGRDNIQFHTRQDGDHLSVIPSDAASLVSSGAVDERLFDVTTLRESGYDDASTNTIPLIATQKAGQAFTAPEGTTTTQPLPSINGSGLSAEKSALESTWDSMTSGGPSTLSGGVDTLWLDGKRSTNLDRSAHQVGADKAWESGVTGKGATVAVLDTGVDQTHPDLKDREAGQKNFTGAPNNADIFGHGTHVAGIVAGTGAHSQGKYKGIAHGAKVLDGKVMNNSGSGKESWIIAGMQWAAEQKADVANLSLGGSDTPGIDPLEKAVNTLSAESDTLFVIAAGNEGPTEESVGSPGSADAALTVGAVDRKGGLAGFSSRGPRMGDDGVKPDITAPGTKIVSALHSEGTIGKPIDGRYTALDGTSMASPHVAGAAALLAQANPKMTGEQLKATLTASAKPNPKLSAFEQGSGLLDVPSALNQPVTGDRSNLSFGIQKWPHHDDKPVTQPLTYHNNGDKDITLDVSVTGKGPDGQPAPDGMFTVDKKHVTIPPGGTAKVTVTADTRGDTADGRYSGAVVADNGKTKVTTPVAVTKEVESYDLTFNQIGLDGKPNSEAMTSITNRDNMQPEPVYGNKPTKTIRLPKGRYLLDSVLITGDQKNPDSHVLIQPSVDLSKNTTIDLDFRKAKPIKVSPPNQNATPRRGEFRHQISNGEQGFTTTLAATDPSKISTAQLGPEVQPEEFTSQVNTEMTSQKGDYQLAWYVPGKAPTGFQRDVSQDELATVHHRFRPSKPGHQGQWSVTPVQKGVDPGLELFFPVDQPLPGQRDVFYNTEGVEWLGMFQESGPQGKSGTLLKSPPRSYAPGKEYDRPFNFAPFAPAMPAASMPWAFRYDNRVLAQLPLLSDGAGNAQADSDALKGRTTLHRGEELIGESPTAGSGRFVVPPEPGRYRLSTEANRKSDLSPHVSGSWTFDSAYSEEEQSLPLSAVRFNPELDDSGSAPRGKQEVPVFLQGNQGEPIPAEELSVEVSYDEGKTWKPAPVDNGKLHLEHPGKAQSVSLRANATDEQGNTVEQTVIKAWKLKG